MKRWIRAFPMVTISSVTTNGQYILVSRCVDSKNQRIIIATTDNDTIDLTITKDTLTETNTINKIVYRPDESAELWFAPNGRNIDPQSPYQGYTTGNSFEVGATVKFSNSPNQYEDIVNITDDQTINGDKTFNDRVIVPTPLLSQDATTKQYVDNLISLGGDIATNNIPGLVGVADVPTFIEGGKYIQPEGEYINLPNQENVLHIKKIRNNPNNTNLYTLDNAGFIYKVTTLNGKQTSTTKLNTTARTDLYKILSVESDNSIYLISTNNNLIVRYTGSNTFTNVSITGTSIPAGRVLSTTEVLTIDGSTATSINAFISFEGSQGVYRLVIANANKLSATSSILPNTTNLYPLNLDYSKDGSLYFSTLSGNSFVIFNLTNNLYRLLLSDNTIQNISVTGFNGYGSLSVWNDPAGVNDDRLVFTAINSTNTNTINNNIYVYEITGKTPLTLSAVSTQMSQPYYSRANPAGSTLSSTNNLLGATILLNYFYSMAVPTQAGQTGFELLSNNLLQDTPASTTPKVIQPLSIGSTPFTIIGRIQNYFNVASNIENKITAEQTLTITPPASAGIRTDLIVLDSNNTLQARLGVIAGAIGTPQAGDRVLGKCQTTFQGDGLDYLVNYDNREISNVENFGDGSDGDAVISTNTTLTRDMYYNNLTINAGIVLNVNNFKIYYNQLSGNGIISSNGNGGAGGTFAGAGGAGGAGGGAGGAGGNSAGGSGGGAGGAVIPMSLSKLKYVLLRTIYIVFTLFKFDNTAISVDRFGFGGGGGSGNNFAGGAGGSGGGILFLCGTINNFNGSLLSNGGNGVVGSDNIGGGGGGGGVIINIYKIKNGSYVTSAIGGLGANTFGGTNGANGADGNIYEFKI